MSNLCNQIDGMSRCSGKSSYPDQQNCDRFMKHSMDNRCTFLIYEQFCDWNPDMACVKNSKYAPDKGKTSWNSYKFKQTQGAGASEQEPPPVSCGF